MTNDAALIRLRADLARQIQTWMDDAFAKVDFNADPDRVIEALTLAWSEVLLRVEAVDQAAQAAGPSPHSVHKSSPLTGITTQPSVTLFDPVD